MIEFQRIRKIAKTDRWLCHACPSVLLPVRQSALLSTWNNSAPTKWILIKFKYLYIFLKSVKKIRVLFKIGQEYICFVNFVYVYLLHYGCIAVLTLDAGLLARNQYPEGPATDHLDTGFSWFPCVYKQMLRWFPSFQVATTCFSCSPPDLNFLVTFFHICLHVN